MQHIENDAVDFSDAISGKFLRLLLENAYRCADDLGKKSADIDSVYHGAMTVMESSPKWIEEIYREARKSTSTMESGEVQGQGSDSSPETKAT